MVNYMDWRIAEAKQRFSELIQAARLEPQQIFNRDQLVAVVLRAELFQEFEAWQKLRNQRSLADSFKQLQQLCQAENYTLEVLPRQNRDLPLNACPSRDRLG